MIASWTVILSALVYLCFLFVVAQYGDRGGKTWLSGRSRATVYALCLSVYCTSWTIYGSVDFASINGIAFLGIYVGPALVFLFGTGLLTRIARLAKSQNSTSIADLIAARYGKNEFVAAAVALIALVAVIPYIALQLKAVSASLTALLASLEGGADTGALMLFGDLSLIVALVLSGFAVAFGTRHIDATEHQDGLMLAIAMEAIVKLSAFLIVGLVIVAPAFLDRLPAAVAEAQARFQPWRLADPVSFLTMAGLSVAAILLLPRQFHVTFVENRDIKDIRRSRWMFPLYLVLINLLVLPIAGAGLALAPKGGSDNALLLLAVPLSRGETLTALIAFIGGLSASTAMVIVEFDRGRRHGLNHLAVPLVLRFHSARQHLLETPGSATEGNALHRRHDGFHSRGPPRRDLRGGDARLPVFPQCTRRSTRGHRPFVLRRDCPEFSRASSRRCSGAVPMREACSRRWSRAVRPGSLALPSFAGSRHGLISSSQGPVGIAWLRPEHLLGLQLPLGAWRLGASRQMSRPSCRSPSPRVDENGARQRPFSSTARPATPAARRSPKGSASRSCRHGCAICRARSRNARFRSFLDGSGSARRSTAGDLSSCAGSSIFCPRRSAPPQLASCSPCSRAARPSRAAMPYSFSAIRRPPCSTTRFTAHALDHAGQGITVFDKERNLLA